MRRCEAINISDLLSEFKKQPNFNQKLLESQIIASWGETLGTAIANSTSNLSISNRTLFVRIDSAIIRNELFMIRSQIANALNKKVGVKVIDDIIFR